MAIRNAHFDITAADKTRPALDSVKRGLGEVGGSVNALKGVFSAFGAVAASLGLTQLLNQAVQAASAAEQSSNRLDAVLRATGNAAGRTREQLDGMADAMARSTTFDDESIREAQSQLIKFGTIHSQTFDRALEAAADYAAFTGGTMADAAHQLGRALAAPKEGLTLLERQIGRFTDAEREAIEVMLEQGRVAEAQALILNKVEGAIGGTAQTMNQGIYGATTAAAKAYDDLMEALGRTGAVKLVVEGNLLGLARTLDIIRGAIEGTTASIEDQIRLAQGQLKQLPPDLRGGPAAPDGTGQLEGMTVTDIGTGTDAFWARQEEEAKAREKSAAEARARALKEREAYFKKAREFDEMIFDSQRQQEDAIAATLEANRKADEEKKQAIADFDAMIEESRLQQKFAIRETLGLRQEEVEELWRTTAAKADAVMAGLQTERELLYRHYDEQMEALVNAHSMGLLAEKDFREQRLRLINEFEKEQTRRHDEEIRRRYGIARVYRKLELEAMQYFFAQAVPLMQSQSRKMFEIGKAAAIAETIIETYRAAQGAYAALAKIPIVGPALGVAAAAAAIASGFARVQAIRSTQFQGGGAAAVGVFGANPSTGLPDSNPAFEPVAPFEPQRAQAPARNVTITLVGEGTVSTSWIRDVLIPSINEAVGDGVNLVTQ